MGSRTDEQPCPSERGCWQSMVRSKLVVGIGLILLGCGGCKDRRERWFMLKGQVKLNLIAPEPPTQ